jgi:hypothetical protein
MVLAEAAMVRDKPSSRQLIQDMSEETASRLKDAFMLYKDASNKDSRSRSKMSSNSRRSVEIAKRASIENIG